MPIPEGMVERKHVFIDKPVQTRYMVLIGTALFLCALVAWGSFYLGLWDGVAKVINDDQLCEVFDGTQAQIQKKNPNLLYNSTRWLFELIGKKGNWTYAHQKVLMLLLWESFIRFLPLFLVFLFFACWMSIIYTHRFVGPFYRIFKDLEVICNGRLDKRINLRKKDEGQEVVEAINHTIARLDLNISMIKRIIREHGSDLERLKSELNVVLSKFVTSTDKSGSDDALPPESL